MKLSRIKKAKGFTLIEVLVVIAIMGILATIAWAATGLVAARQDRKQAEMDIALIDASLQAYKADSGGIMPYADGYEWSSHILYSMLTGDTDNDGHPDKSKDGLLNQVYCTSIAIYTSGDSNEKKVGIPAHRIKLAYSPDTPKKYKNSNVKRFALLDPWDKPYRYRLGCEADCEDIKKVGRGLNVDFDIFSQGPDRAGSALDNKGENEDNISNIKGFN